MKSSSKLTTMCAILLIIGAVEINARVVKATCDEDCQELMHQKRPTVVKFSANWCGVCKAIESQFEEVSNDPEFKDIAFVEIDLNKARKTSQANGVTGVPSFLFLHGNDKKHETVGVRNIRMFKEHLREDIRSSFNLPT